MKITLHVIYILCLLAFGACNQSKKTNEFEPELRKGFSFTTENGWKIPDNAVLLTQEQVLKLSKEDETDLAMNDYYLLAVKQISDNIKTILWIKNNTADTQAGGIAYLSLTNANGNAIETMEVANFYECESGRFFDVFLFDEGNRFSKSRMVKSKEGDDVLFRYEYQIKENGTLELQGEFVNRSAVDDVAAENAGRNSTIYDAGVSFLHIGEPFYATSLPKGFEISSQSADGSQEITENGVKIFSFIQVNNLLEEIRVYSEGYATEKNIRVGSTFSQLKSAYTVEVLHCRADDGVWAMVKETPRMEFQLNVPMNIPCDKNDEMPVSSVPDNTKVTCVRVVAQ